MKNIKRIFHNFKTNFHTIGKFNKLVAFTGIVGKIGPTTSPTTESLALLDPNT